MHQVPDIDLELLDGYLDGELSADQVHRLRRRLETEPALAGALALLREERDVRLQAYESMEDEAAAQRVIGQITRQVRRDAHIALVLRALKPLAGVAACAMIFLAGWIGRGWVDTTSPQGDTVYKVILTDDTGRRIEQTFATREEADAFAEELRRYQELYRQIQTGQAVPVMAYH